MDTLAIIHSKVSESSTVFVRRRFEIWVDTLAIVHSKVSEYSTVCVRRFEGMGGYPGYGTQQG